MNPQPLEGQEIALSVSTAPDMGKLGYPSREVDRALFGICGALVRAGARIAYGGHVEPNGYTFKIFTFLAKAYAVRGQEAPFVHYLAVSELRRAEFDMLERIVREGNGIIETRLVLDGQVAATLIRLEGGGFGLRWATGRFESVPTTTALAGLVGRQMAEEAGPALTAMRQLVSQRCRARIVMGGKMGLLADPLYRYSGEMPGIVEECLATLEQRKLLIVLGAFGGATRDVAIALGLLPQETQVPRGPQMESYWPALRRVERFREMAGHRGLAELARMDRTEVLAHAVVGLLAGAG